MCGSVPPFWAGHRLYGPKNGERSHFSVSRQTKAASAQKKADKAPAQQEEDKTIYKVVVNHEEQYSIWPAYKDIPQGWSDTGKTGTKDECLAYIKEVWTDMRPLSLKKKMEADAEVKLDKTAVSALLLELKADLKHFIDEAAVSAIGRKWSARGDLAGQSRTPILNILFEDVKSVVGRKETEDKIWASWKTVGVKQTPPQPPTGLQVVSDSSPTAAPTPSPARAGHEQGTVKSFNLAKGFGFIARKQGADLFFDHTSVVGLENLKAGGKVEFKVVQGPKGAQAQNVVKIQ
jgi:MbtH protein